MVYSAKAYAKINLYLNVLGKRSDGYHNVDTLMQSVSLYDTVTVELCGSDITVSCDSEVLSFETNIAAVAAKKFFEFANLSCGVKITIEKRIPVAAGMGGGSADAAATLLLLNKATGKNFSISDLMPIAKSLGADVPFFLLGGAARAQGIGELLTPVSNALLYIVLVKEGAKQSTGQMYSIVDTLNEAPFGNIECLIEGLKTNNLETVCNNLYNSFTACWNFEEMCKPFSCFSPKAEFLSGSGPTVGAIFESEVAAKKCAESLSKQGLNAFYVQTVDTGIEIV